VRARFSTILWPHTERKAGPLVPESPAVEARGLSRFYGAFVAIRDLSFSIPAGQVVALLGPNGAGKSTTMKILTGYLAASEGTAGIAGHDIKSDRLAAARSIGYLPENGPLYRDMTPLDSLRFFGAARGLDRATLAGRIDEVVDQCGLGDILEKAIGKLSKGLRQRVALAQALVHDPEVLIMDEPTAGLDPNQIQHFRALVQQLRGRKTLLLSTHILQEVDAVAERVLLVHRGRLAFDGTMAEVRERGSLEALFHALTQDGAPA
jgi:ABC-2 type transport system ATP-binding protein